MNKAVGFDRGDRHRALGKKMSEVSGQKDNLVEALSDNNSEAA
jgi:hypothetical protein